MVLGTFQGLKGQRFHPPPSDVSGGKAWPSAVLLPEGRPQRHFGHELPPLLFMVRASVGSEMLRGCGLINSREGEENVGWIGGGQVGQCAALLVPKRLRLGGGVSLGCLRLGDWGPEQV